MQATQKCNVSVSTDLYMQGYSGIPPNGPWTPDKVVKALGWFKKNEQGIDLAAKLRHYSTIEPTFPRTVGVSPEVFADLHGLYTTVWDVRSGYASMPRHYQDRYKQEFRELDEGVMANQHALATDSGKRLQFRRLADALLSKINDVFSRMDFYHKVKSKVGAEPGKDQVVVEGTGQQKWLYGYSTYTKSNAVVINKMEMRHSEKGKAFDFCQHTFEFGPDDKNLIVGWEVVSNWGDGTNGEWSKVVDQILLTGHAAVHVKSQLFRGFDWTVWFYYVAARDYDF
jgi:hypothetical protein